MNVGALPVGAQGTADCADLLSMAMMIDSGEWIITYADLGQQAFPLRLTSIENRSTLPSVRGNKKHRLRFPQPAFSSPELFLLAYPQADAHGHDAHDDDDGVAVLPRQLRHATKFMPYHPTSSVSGRKIVVTIVRICMMRFCRVSISA